MRVRGWAGEGLLPVGWPAGHITSPENKGEAIDWHRLFFGAQPTRTLRRVLVWTACTVVMFHYLLLPIKVVGASMTPTYRDGSVNLVNRMAYARRAPQRGDVVVLHDGEDLILKRVVAIPGETVTLDRGRLRVNGIPLHDQFSVEIIPADFEQITLGPDEFFVIGDNRTASIFGKFPRHAILGKLMF